MSRTAARRADRRPTQQSYRRHLKLETLEARAMLAVDLQGISITPTVVNEGSAVTLTGSISTIPVSSGLQLWLDASDLSTIVTDGANNVERWLDKSGLQNHAFEKTANARPALNPIALNGRPAIRFDGVDDGMAIADTLNVTGAYTIFIVDQYYSNQQGRTLQSRDGAVNAGTNWLIGKWAGANANYVNGHFVANVGAAGTEPTIGVGIGGGGNASSYHINGINMTTNAAPGGSPGHLALGQEGTFRNNGTDNPTTADVAEILVYDRNLTSAERRSVEEFLARKYNMGLGSSFTGGDAGEGLDLDGNFVYAVNTIDPRVPVGLIRDANFTADNVPGVSIVATANIPAGGWGAPNYGATLNDDRLETIMASIRHAGAAPGQIPVTMGNLTVGGEYKLQLLFGEQCCDRGFDILAEGKQVGFNVGVRPLQGQASANTSGGVFTYEFVATDTTLDVLLVGGTGTFPDTNPIINGFTLEHLNAPPLTVPPATTTVGTFTGGDVGEGLDFDGNFAYAVNFASGNVGAVRDVNFAGDSVPGVTYNFNQVAANWFAGAEYGATTNDDRLETVMRSIRWSTAPVSLDVTNLVRGTRYKAQLLFGEACCDRGFDVVAEGQKIVDRFSVQTVQGGINNTSRGVVVTYDFMANDDTLSFFLQTPSNPAFPDNNPILQGLTLEVITPAAPVPPPAPVNTVTINWNDGGPNTTLQLPAGVNTFSATRNIADNLPNGALSGTITPVVSVQNLIDGTTDTFTSQVVGDSLINRAVNDGANGALIVLDEPISQVGRVTDWAFFDDDGAGRQITPLLLERVGDNYVIRAVGTTRTSTGGGVQNHPFAATSGNDAVTSNKFYIAWKDGSLTANNQGVIDYVDLPASPANDGMRYFGDTVHANNLGIGRDLGAGTAFGRDYSIQFTVAPSVTVVDVAPTAALVGSFTVLEGGTVALAASATDPAGVNDTITFAWDLDNDGIFGETGAAATRGVETGAAPVFSAAGLDGPGAFPIAVRASDDDGLTGAVVTGSVAITNRAPTVAITTAPSTTAPGFATSYTFTATDVSTADQAGTFLYTIDWGDGNIETDVSSTATLTISHTYESVGDYPLSVTVKDKDLTPVSAAATLDVNVSLVAVVGDVLIVSGTNSNDRIIIQPGRGGVTVRHNNKMLSAPPFSEKLVILGHGGADTITISGSLGVPTEIYGGDGNDYITGGRGNDLIDGGGGSDRLFGGIGDDQLFGGNGNDSMVGGTGDDELDGGDGVDNMQGEVGADTLLGGAGKDRLTGGTGNDYLDGGDDADRLDGGTGDDMLLGQAGGDNLYGNTGNDVLLGGHATDLMYGGRDEDLLAADTTAHDLDPIALAAIWSQWSSGGMSSRPGLASLINSTTVPVNDGFDIIYGEAGSDWYLTFSGDTNRGFASGDFLEPR